MTGKESDSWDDHNDDQSEKISSYNFTLKPPTATSAPSTADSAKKTSPKVVSSSGGTKLLFGKLQTSSSHPTRVFSLKKGRGMGSGSVLQQGQDSSSGDVVGRGRGRGRGTKPIVNVAPPTTTSNVGTNASTGNEATPSSVEATPSRTAPEETAAAESGSESVSSTQEVNNDEQFEDASNENDDSVTTESKKELVKPKRYSSQRQKPGDGELDGKQNENTLPPAPG